MARRDRTTGLPRPKRRERQQKKDGRNLFGNDWVLRSVLLGVPALFIVAIVGFLGWRWYDDAFLRPDKVILEVGDRETTLGYYRDRLPQFARENTQAGLTVPQALFQKLEEEELTILLAQEQGLDLSDEAVTAWIAEQLNVEPSTEKDSPYDTAYRSLLRSTGLSDSAYRRLATAALADELVKGQLSEGLGTGGETLSYRFFSTVDEELAQDAFARIEGGEGFDAVADDVSPIAPTASPTPTEDPDATGTPETTGTPATGTGTPTDSATPTAGDATATTTPGEGDEGDGEGEDGEGEDDEPEDVRLVDSVIEEQLPEVLREALADAEVGDVVGPIQVGQTFFIITLTERNEDSELTEQQVALLTEEQFTDVIDEVRQRTEIVRSLSSGDISWAIDNA